MNNGIPKSKIPESNYGKEVMEEIDSILNKDVFDSKQKYKNIIINNSWNERNEQIIASIGENAISYKWLHDQSSIFFKTTNTCLNIITILISTGLSAQTFFPENTTDNSLTISKRIFIYITNVLTITLNYLKYSELSIQHTASANKFSELYNEIRYTMCLYRKDRPMATKYIYEIIKKYDSLTMAGPEISLLILNRFKNRFKNASFSLPDIADGINKIEIITEQPYDSKTNKTYDSKTNDSKTNDSKTNDYELKISHNNPQTSTSNIRNINKISKCIDGDLTEEDLTCLNVSEINDLKKKAIVEKQNYEDQRYLSSF